MTPRPANGLAHPYFAEAGPCTLLIEAPWAPIAGHDDWSALHAKLAAIDRMAKAYGTRARPVGRPSPDLRRRPCFGHRGG